MVAQGTCFRGRPGTALPCPWGCLVRLCGRGGLRSVPGSFPAPGDQPLDPEDQEPEVGGIKKAMPLTLA